jgi:hypothetical protein
MGNTDAPDDDPPARDEAERRLRGDALEGSERKKAADHGAYERSRNPDTELHLDGEKDTLYNDGLDIDEEDPDDPLYGTRDNSSGIKP